MPRVFYCGEYRLIRPHTVPVVSFPFPIFSFSLTVSFLRRSLNKAKRLNDKNAAVKEAGEGRCDACTAENFEISMFELVLWTMVRLQFGPAYDAPLSEIAFPLLYESAFIALIDIACKKIIGRFIWFQLLKVAGGRGGSQQYWIKPQDDGRFLHQFLKLCLKATNVAENFNF